MNTVLYLIVVHDPKIISKFESDKKYKGLNYKYVLVGAHETDYTSSIIIQCDKLKFNIEHYNNYLAYTGWWAIGKNLLDTISESYLFFLEYDTNLIDIEQLLLMETNLSNVKISGIAELPITTCFFDNNHSKNLQKFLKFK